MITRGQALASITLGTFGVVAERKVVQYVDAKGIAPEIIRLLDLFPARAQELTQ